MTLDTPVEVGHLRTIAVAGDPVAFRSGGSYARIGSSSINDRGEIAFAAELVGSTAEAATPAIVHVVGGRSTTLVRAGEPAPDGGRYAGFGEVDLGEDGSLLFEAGLAGTAADRGLFLRTESGTREVARAGAGFPHASFGPLSLVSYQLPDGPYFRLAYVAHTLDGRRSLVIWPSYRDQSTVLTTGDPVAGGTLADFTISRGAFAVCVIAQIRSGATSRRVVLLVNEDQVLWDPRLRDGATLPDLGRITRVREGSGMYVHHGFVATELDDGRTVLVLRSGGGDPEVFARTGDTAPGLAGQQMTRFGPVLANNGLPDGGPCGIACPVELSGGARALWLGVFASQRPMAGAAIVPLFAGDYTDDQPAARVDTFTPVKLTNTGSLLLRATVAADGRSANGLLTLDRLFAWHQG